MILLAILLISCAGTQDARYWNAYQQALIEVDRDSMRKDDGTRYFNLNVIHDTNVFIFEHKEKVLKLTAADIKKIVKEREKK